MTSERQRLVLGATWTVASTIVALAVGAIFNPVLVLYLGVEGYGIWASAIAIASLIGLGGDLGVASALTKVVAGRRGLDQGVGSLVSSALVIGIFAGIVAGGALAVLALFIGQYFVYSQFALLLELQAMQVPLNLGASSLMGVIQGKREFRSLAFFTMGQSVSNLLVALGLLALGLGIPGVMIGALLTSAVVFSLLVVSMKAELIFVGFAKFRKDFRQLIPFGLNVTATNALSTLLYSVDLVALSILVRNPAIVGAYALAVFITRALWILPTSISTTTYPVVSEYSAASDRRRVSKYLTTALSVSVALTGILSSSLILFGRPLTRLVFGAEAVPAYEIALILLPGTAILGSLRSVAPSLAAVGRPDIGLRISALGAGALTILASLTASASGATGVAASVSAIFVMISIVLFWALNHYVLHDRRGLLASRNVTMTVSLAIATGAGSILMALPSEFETLQFVIGAGFWILTGFAMTWASGGMATWGTLIQRSSKVQFDRS